MAYQVEVEQAFYFVKTSELNNIPIVEGNFIVLSDGDGIFYDVGNPAGSGTNVIRREVSGRTIFVESLPEIGDSNNTYILDTGHNLIGTDQTEYEVYCWNNSAWQLVATNTQDINVNSVVSNNTKAYITGSATATSNTGILIKREDVYITADGKLHANGYEGSIDNAVSANSAQQANNDTTGRPITNYVLSVEAGSSNKLKIKTGNNDVTTVDTYIPPILSTTVASCVPAVTNTSGRDVLLSNGWQPLSEISVGSSVKDQEGQTIDSTYIKNVAYDNSTQNLVLTKGNGTDSTVNIPISSYSDYTGSTHGLVPPSSSQPDKSNYFLNMAGIWGQPPIMEGASSSTSGKSGLVPAPTLGTDDRYLRVDGSWSTPPAAVPYSSTTSGVVPAYGTSSAYTFLNTDGWRTIPTYIGPTNQSAGISGLVPSATIADANKYLRGDGSWEIIPTFTTSTSGLVPAPTVASSDTFLNSEGSWISPLPQITADTSFTVLAGLTITSNQYGQSYFITLDGTATDAIAANASIASTTKTFYKVYAVGYINSNSALFTLDGNTLSCNEPISIGDTIAVSFTALA